MALNIQTFRTRALSSAIFIVVVLAGLLINQWTFFILFSMIHFGCWMEYQRLVGLIDKEYRQITSFHKYGVMIAGWCIMLYFTTDDYKIFGLRLHELGWWIGLIFVFLLPVTELLFAKTIRLKNIGHSILGLIYISLSLGLMMDIRSPREITDLHAHNIPHVFSPPDYPILIVLSIWINDTMAYIVGSLMGKRSLSKISPRKTWEGTIGGVILCIGIIGFLFPQFFLPGIDFTIITIAVPIAVISSVAGTFGDLLESKLKRMANVKDSGNLMPGHGGFLDRFDSMLVAIPFVWLYIVLFIR